jgi:hypothetical protein
MTGLTATAMTAMIMKMLPYMIAVKVAGGIVDITVHAIKQKISKAG